MLAQRLRAGDHLHEVSGVPPARARPVRFQQTGHLRPGEVERLGVVLEPGEQRHVRGRRPVAVGQLVGAAGQALRGQPGQCGRHEGRVQVQALHQVVGGELPY
ncbi:hypothetical protein [Streptomyces sp. B93]|uniref:hypothetical protein n=1 Tax=Streptomyces sp. B93 TaxID=2824875 RepID=UPI0027E4D829|nr:hypothetical protein [Streptomyces sp. B93]